MSSDLSPDQLRQAILDEEHLKLLSIGYLVSASLSAFTSFIGIFYAFMGFFMGSMISRMPSRPGQSPPPEFMGWFFGLFGVAIFAILMTLGVLKLLTYRSLKQRRSRTFCMVVAGISCLGIPYGTLLGVFTFLVLSRPSVKALFSN